MSANGGPAVRARRSSARSTGEDAREIWCDISRACVYASVVVVVVVVVVHAVRARLIFRRGGATPREAPSSSSPRETRRPTTDGGGDEARRDRIRRETRAFDVPQQSTGRRVERCRERARAIRAAVLVTRHSARLARAYAHDTITGVRPHRIRTRRPCLRETRDVKNHIATS